MSFVRLKSINEIKNRNLKKKREKEKEKVNSYTQKE